MHNPPSFNYRSHGYSSEKSLNEILDLLTFLYYSIVGGGLPVDASGTLTAKQDFVAAAGPIDCATAPQTIVVGDATRQNDFKIVSLMFDNDVARDVRVSIIIDGEPRTWFLLPAYTGSYIMSTDGIEGRHLQLQIDVSQYAGAFSYSVAGETL
jgi:hypothetical protein